VAELTIVHYRGMAPAHFKSSKPKFQPRAGTKVLAGKIEKKASKQSNLTVHTFATVLTIRTRNDATNDAPTDHAMQDTVDNAVTDHAMQDTVDTALTGQVNEESLVTNPPSATEAPVLVTKEMNKPFKLDEAIPKAGLRFLGEWDGRKRSIMGRWTSENEVAKALHADMAIIHKRHAQGVISPIFHQAAKMLEDGYMWGLARHEDITRRRRVTTGSASWEGCGRTVSGSGQGGCLRIVSLTSFLLWRRPGGQESISRRLMGESLDCWFSTSHCS
jgi:hypothetical protein